MVRAERFELPTFWFVARRSIQLSYARSRNPNRLTKQAGKPKYIARIQSFDGTPLLVRTNLCFAG